MARKGYASIEQQMEANKRYLKNNPEAKERKKISAMKSNCKRFIWEFANMKELSEIAELIEKSKEDFKMEKRWGEIKETVNLATDVNVDKDNIGENGDCIVDIVAGKYKDFSVSGKIIFGEDEDVLTIDDNAVVYNPAE